MPSYTVERVDQAKPFTTKAGHDLVSYTVLLKGEDGIGDIAQRNMNPDSKAPQPEDVWDCTLEPNGNFPKKVKMTQKPFGGGGGGYKGKSPEEQRAITRSVAWKIVVGERGLLDRDAAEYDRVQPWVKKVFDDLQKASQG